MEYKGSLFGNIGDIIEKVAVYGAGAAIRKGVAIMRGTTLGTNLNFGIIATGALTNIIGVTYEPHALVASGADTNANGTVVTYRQTIVDPFAYFRAEFDQTDTMAVASTSSTVVTVTSGETNMQGGWLYAVSGAGAGALTVVTTDDASGGYTTKDNPQTVLGWDNTTVLIKIVPKWHNLIKLNTTGDAIGSDAVAGSGRVIVRDLWMKADSFAETRLDMTLHSGLTGLNGVNVKFFADIVFQDHVFNRLA